MVFRSLDILHLDRPDVHSMCTNGIAWEQLPAMRVKPTQLHPAHQPTSFQKDLGVLAKKDTVTARRTNKNGKECAIGPVGTCYFTGCAKKLGPAECREPKEFGETNHNYKRCYCKPEFCATADMDFCAPAECVDAMNEKERDLDHLEHELSDAKAEMAMTDAGVEQAPGGELIQTDALGNQHEVQMGPDGQPAQEEGPGGHGAGIGGQGSGAGIGGRGGGAGIGRRGGGGRGHLDLPKFNETTELKPSEVEELENVEEDKAAKASGWDLVTTYGSYTKALQKNIDMITLLGTSPVIPKIRPTVDALREETSGAGLGENLKLFSEGLQNIADQEKHGNFNSDRITMMTAGDIPEIFTPMVNQLTELRKSATMLRNRLQGISHAATLLEGNAEIQDSEASRQIDKARKVEAARAQVLSNAAPPQRVLAAPRMEAVHLQGSGSGGPPRRVHSLAPASTPMPSQTSVQAPPQMPPGHGMEVAEFDPGLIEPLPRTRLTEKGFPPVGMTPSSDDDLIPSTENIYQPIEVQQVALENKQLDERMLAREGELEVQGLGDPDAATMIADSFASSVEALRHRDVGSALGHVACPTASLPRQRRWVKHSSRRHSAALTFL